MARVSTCIMAHPRRQHFIPELTERLGDVPVIWDRRNDRWDTGRRAILAADPKATHHLIVQDDAIVCRDLIEGVAKAVEFSGEHPLGLYTGRGAVGNLAWERTRATSRAHAEGVPWIELEGPWWGVAIVIPTAHIDELLGWCDGQSIENYDRRISRWYELQRIKCWYTVPSLVDHRTVKENPSLIQGRTDNRVAQIFIGEQASPLDIDWSVEPIPVGPPPKRRRQMAKVRRTYVRDERGRAVLTEVRRHLIADRNVTVDGPHGVPVRIRAGKPVPFHLQTAYERAAAPDAAEPTKLDGLTYPQLQKLVKQRNVTPKGRKKADLIEALS